MRLSPRLLKRWQFSAGILAPIILCLLVTAAVVAGFVFWSTADLDARSLQRQLRLAAHVIERKVAEVPHEQESVAIWDDAVANTKLGFNYRWIEGNLGRWMYDYFGHDRTIVLDAADRPVYANEQGISVHPALYEADVAVYAPLVAQLRASLAAGALQAYTDGTVARYPGRVEIATVAGFPAIVSVVPLGSHTGALYQQAGTEFLQVSVVFLDAAFADRLSEEYLLENAGIVRQPSSQVDRAVYPIQSSAGRFIGFLAWDADRPGQIMLAQTAPALAGAFLIAALIVIVLLDRLWRSSTALEAGRLAAHHQATHDSLTGLANRARFDDMLGRLLAGKRGRDQTVIVLMLDLDRFKQVNDTLGHHAGDDLIRAVGRRLEEIVGPRDTLARLGGDEFAIIHLSKGDVGEALALSRRIIEAIGKPFEIFGSETFIGISVGIVVAEPTDTDRGELTRKADIALYEAKSAGRNCAVVYEEAMNELLQNRHTVEAELREALRRTDQLSVAFQPLFSGRTGTIAGAEALVRWVHPTLGQVPPAHFIPVAEGTGLIGAVGEFVLRKACELGAKWPGRTIAVNISPTQLRNPAFPERVLDLLVETGMQTQDLELEITEGILLDDERTTAAALRILRGAGIRIALDDFGTGYSSLNYLKRYPVDRIKIDRSFVGQLAPGSESNAIVQAMVTLAHALNIEVTAEGVETHDQMKVLKAMGCNAFQGFLLSVPVSESTIDAKFRKAAGQLPEVSQLAARGQARAGA